MHTKRNDTRFANALYCEAGGLELLREAVTLAGVNELKVPEVFSVSEGQLQMTEVDASPPSDTLFRALGKGLALIHRLPQSHVGFHRDNYIGLNPQKNGESDNWGDFFLEYRLGYQVGMISDARLRDQFSEVLHLKGNILAAWLNEHTGAPALLHGDLWSGNVMFDRASSWLIDPAVYYGDPEADLAMTEMFGGFGKPFYQAYEAVRPLSTHYGRKREIYNLYHFLNHYNLFGSAYLASCQKAFNSIENL
ncbi:MAG: fructosamine kinase family protein [Saccharospirillum sp.]|uniref:fructosamine kinase family protein n=1 Tax=Saccharospirillum sp. TaxID=2033801 RepID=UPI003298D816